jgi:hypothetical protein
MHQMPGYGQKRKRACFAENFTLDRKPAKCFRGFFDLQVVTETLKTRNSGGGRYFHASLLSSRMTVICKLELVTDGAISLLRSKCCFFAVFSLQDFLKHKRAIFSLIVFPRSIART